ncbi:MAG: hypothetical protein F6K09_06275 [Merismopedia sp. SIO2A8]|nr:hypothetical protein [Merismopedia sp. SIO2A8]
MFQPSTPGADASTVSAERSPSSTSRQLSSIAPPVHETVRHMLFGSTKAVQHTIKLLHKLNYAEPNDWSKPIPTGQPNEVVSVLVRKVRVG